MQSKRFQNWANEDEAYDDCKNDMRVKKKKKVKYGHLKNQLKVQNGSKLIIERIMLEIKLGSSL